METTPDFKSLVTVFLHVRALNSAVCVQKGLCVVQYPTFLNIPKVGRGPAHGPGIGGTHRWRIRSALRGVLALFHEFALIHT